VKDQLEELLKESQVNCEDFKSYCDNFYKAVIDTHKNIVIHFLHVFNLDWTGLKKVHDWQCVQECCCSITTVGTNCIVDETELLQQICMCEGIL